MILKCNAPKKAHMLGKQRKFIYDWTINDNSKLTVKGVIDKYKGKIKVIYKDLKTKKNFTSEEYDTVLLAIGRTPNTSKLNLDKIGVKVDKRTKKILTNKYDQTNIDNIYAIGDVAFNRPELTPPAIRAGKLLVNRLFTKGTIEQNIMNYERIKKRYHRLFCIKKQQIYFMQRRSLNKPMLFIK